MGNLTTNSYYHFQSHDTSINIYEVGSVSGVGQINYPSGVSAVWANDTNLYIATQSSGVVYTPISSISGGNYNDFYSFAMGPIITADTTAYVHGAGNYLCVSTVSGVDRYELSTSNRIYTQDTDIGKCHQSSDGSLYYIENQTFLENQQIFEQPTINWEYYQIITVSGIDNDRRGIMLRFEDGFPIDKIRTGGADLRFCTEDGQVIKYYIESWYPDDILIILRSPVATMERFYMFYGNSLADAPGYTPQEVYDVYDSFDYADFVEMDQVWDPHCSFGCNWFGLPNYWAFQRYRITHRTKFAHGRTLFYIKANKDSSGFDFEIGFSSSSPTTNPNRGEVNFESTYADEDAPVEMRLLSPWSSTQQHTIDLWDTSWQWLELIIREGHQRAVFGEIVLESFATGLPKDKYHICLLSQNYSYLQLSEVYHLTGAFEATATIADNNVLDEFKPKLHAVYEPTTNWSGADHVYYDFLDTPLQLNDIYVNDGVSIYNNDNLIFLGTDKGVHIIEEKRGDESNARYKRYLLE